MSLERNIQVFSYMDKENSTSMRLLNIYDDLELAKCLSLSSLNERAAQLQVCKHMCACEHRGYVQDP